MGNINEDGDAVEDPKSGPPWGCRIWLILFGLAILAICSGFAYRLWSA